VLPADFAHTVATGVYAGFVQRGGGGGSARGAGARALAPRRALAARALLLAGAYSTSRGGRGGAVTPPTRGRGATKNAPQRQSMPQVLGMLHSAQQLGRGAALAHALRLAPITFLAIVASAGEKTLTARALLFAYAYSTSRGGRGGAVTPPTRGRGATKNAPQRQSMPQVLGKLHSAQQHGRSAALAQALRLAPITYLAIVASAGEKTLAARALLFAGAYSTSRGGRDGAVAPPQLGRGATAKAPQPQSLPQVLGILHSAQQLGRSAPLAQALRLAPITFLAIVASAGEKTLAPRALLFADAYSNSRGGRGGAVAPPQRGRGATAKAPQPQSLPQVLGMLLGRSAALAHALRLAPITFLA
jgi:hypothetical protein